VLGDEHKTLCKPYVDLPPRDSKDYRLHILVPCHSGLEPILVWRKDLEAAMDTIAPGPSSLRRNLTDLPPNTDEDQRWTAAKYVRDSTPNVVLGNLISGRPTVIITGSLLSVTTNAFKGREDISDAMPSDLHKIVQQVALHEQRFGPVKTSSTPYQESS
jgi:hypothetical protein